MPALGGKAIWGPRPDASSAESDVASSPGLALCPTVESSPLPVLAAADREIAEATWNDGRRTAEAEYSFTPSRISAAGGSRRWAMWAVGGLAAVVLIVGLLAFGVLALVMMRPGPSAPSIVVNVNQSGGPPGVHWKPADRRQRQRAHCNRTEHKKAAPDEAPPKTDIDAQLRGPCTCFRLRSPAAPGPLPPALPLAATPFSPPPERRRSWQDGERRAVSRFGSPVQPTGFKEEVQDIRINGIFASWPKNPMIGSTSISVC